jgi:hypothetical protein
MTHPNRRQRILRAVIRCEARRHRPRPLATLLAMAAAMYGVTSRARAILVRLNARPVGEGS